MTAERNLSSDVEAEIRKALRVTGDIRNAVLPIGKRITSRITLSTCPAEIGIIERALRAVDLDALHAHWRAQERERLLQPESISMLSDVIVDAAKHQLTIGDEARAIINALYPAEAGERGAGEDGAR